MRRASFQACALAALLSASAKAQPLVPQGIDYCRAIRVYAGGNVNGAVAVVQQLSTTDHKRAMLAIRSCQDSLVTPEAATLLETELALAEQHEVSRVRDQLTLAEQIVQKLTPTSYASQDERDRVGRFQERWYVAAASLMMAWTEPDAARSLADRGLRQFKNSARLQLLVGMTEEMRAHIADGNLHDSAFIVDFSRNPLRLRVLTATTAFRKALSLDPSLADARVHLGRMLYLSREIPEARALLTTVVGDEGVRMEARYLAHLFLGAVDEYDKDLAAAVGHYQAAVDLAPDHQTARVALSFAARKLGRDADAHTTVEEWSLRKPGDEHDPWLDYQNGAFDWDSFEMLRAQVVRKATK